MDKEQKRTILKYIKNDILIFGAIFISAVTLYLIFGVNCPVKFFLKIDCPFCGMTRAHLAALRFDFKEALEYHPLFFLGIPYLFLLFHDELFKGKFKKLYIVLVITLTLMFIILWLFKVFHQ